MKSCEIIIALLVFVFTGHNGFSYELYEQIKVGGLFDDPTFDAEIAFQYAVDAVNNQRYDAFETMFEATTMRVGFGDQFEAAKKLCRLFKTGVWAVLGPSSADSAEHIQSICDAKEMPLVENRFNAKSQMPVVNLHPHPPVLAKVFKDLIKVWEWKSFTVLFEKPSWLPYIEEILKYFSSKGITVRQLEWPNKSGNYRQVLQRVKIDGEKHILLCCSVDILPDVLKHAQQVGILTDHHQYIITSLDTHTIDLEPYQYGGTNITGVRLVNPNNRIVKQVTGFFRQQHMSRGIEFPESLSADFIKVDTALAYDSVVLMAETIKQHKDNGNLKAISLKCDSENSTWTNGLTISTFMKETIIDGLTGTIRFDHQGHRSNFELEVIELVSDGIKSIGTWNSTSGLSLSRMDVRHRISSSMVADKRALQNESFIVLIAINKPYNMLKDNIQKLEGNDRFEGFAIELIEELSRMLGFNYTFKLQEDNAYGSLDKKTGEWNGMIREIMEGRAHLAITDLTITSEREGAVDFTHPFMNLGISILYQKPKKENPEMFSFMSPFSNEVWLCLGIAFFGVTLSLFIMARLSPAEWDNPYPCIEEPDVLENQFNLQNSVWFAIGALLQQGSEVAPKAASVRIVASMWYFFTLIMVSSYTANLAAFLTIETLSSPFDNVEGLASLNGEIPFGAKRDGSTYNFFNDSTNPTHRKMFQWMEKNPQHMTGDNDEGVDRAKKGKYAFLMESSTIDYIIERECKITRVGGLLDAKGYGIAMKKGSRFRAPLSEKILQLQETGKLSQMQIKWWKEKRGGGACSGPSGGESAAEELKMANVMGVFMCLIAAGVVAVFVAICQMILEVRSRSKELEAPFKDELIEELKFVGKLKGNTRTVKKRKSSSRNSIESVPQTPQSIRSSRSKSKSKTRSRKDLLA